MNINKFLLQMVLVGIFFSYGVVATTPYWGSLHQHTGYSAGLGYDENPNTLSDGCYFPLEGHDNKGKNVSTLSSHANNEGISWLGLSDHSYCINQTEFNKVKTDCQNFRNSTFTCLIGEEISAAEIVDDIEIAWGCNPFGIGDDGEAHLGGYGISNIISQTPSSTHCPSDPDVQEAINNIESQNGFSVLNHPVDDTGLFLEFLDFESIYNVSGYNGIEIFNDDWDTNDQASRDIWRTLLLQGKRIFAYGGTDSHDDLDDVNYNVVYLTGNFNDTNIQTALESGYHFVSNNGEMFMEIKYNGNTYHMGETFTVQKDDIVNISLVYDLDSGCSIRIIKGELGYGVESQYNNYFSGQGAYNTSNIISNNSYFRAECFSGNKRIFTNPIWVNVTATSSCSCTAWSAGSCSAGGCGANERQYTRSCTPSVCDAEAQCVPDVSCLGGSTLITVCASGCDYTTIQSAIDNSNPGDHINITDSRNYAENLVIDSGDAEWLECGAGANISRNSGVGINVVNPSTVDDIYIRGCTIKNFGVGILLNHTTNARLENLSFINVGTSIYLDDDSDTNKIINNTISVSQDYGIFLAGTSWAGPSLNQIKYNKVYDSAVYGLWFKWGLQSQVIGNTINGSDDSGDFGFWFNGGGLNLDSDIYNNTIYSNDIGFDNRGDNNRIYSNIFCPINPNRDIVISSSSSGLSGDYNTCDNSIGWNDTGVVGCRYSCDSSPSTYLIGPLDSSILIKKDSNFTCYSEDATQLANVTLYHNATGIWYANQTKTITGISNISVFTVENLVNGTNFIWNCKTSDNSSHSSFASNNWSVTVNLINRIPTTPTVLGCNNDYCVSNNTFSNQINISCFGSVDDDEDEITYFLDAFYNNTWNSIGNHTQSSQLVWNISSISGQSNISLRCRAIDLFGSNTYSAYYNPSMSLKIYNSINDTNKFLIQNSSAYTVAWLGDFGNIALMGTCSISSNCVAPSGSFIIANSTDDSTAYIDLSGNLCLESGSCSDSASSCNPTTDAFIVQNTTGYNMSYIDFNGNLCLKGGLYTNVSL